MVCAEVPNQIKFVSRPHPTGYRNDFTYIYRLWFVTGSVILILSSLRVGITLRRLSSMLCSWLAIFTCSHENSILTKLESLTAWGINFELLKID
jgi:hypothetical protein